MEHHRLDPYPVPRERVPMFINEPWLIDRSLLRACETVQREPEDTEDNIRIYLPMDLNRDAIMRRLECVISLYKEASEANEMDFSLDVDEIISQSQASNPYGDGKASKRIADILEFGYMTE